MPRSSRRSAGRNRSARSISGTHLVNEAFTTTIADIQISLSTTSKAVDGLSNTFADNVGSDSTTIYSGSLTLSSTNAAGPGGTHVFDIAIHFQNDFVYNPASGNLLLSIVNISGADSIDRRQRLFRRRQRRRRFGFSRYGPKGLREPHLARPIRSG